MANIASALLILLLAAPAAYAATTYTVGDTNGWTTSGDYTTWASDKTFTVGDSLCKLNPCLLRVLLRRVFSSSITLHDL